MRSKTKQIAVLRKMYSRIKPQFVSTPKLRAERLMWEVTDRVKRKVPEISFAQRQALRVRLWRMVGLI